MNTKLEDRYIWLNGEVVHLPEAKINILAPTSQFALNVFEGIRCYWNEEKKQLFAFRLDDHYLRLHQSSKILKLEETYTTKQMKEALIKVVLQNEYHEDIAVRQTLFVEGTGSWSTKGPVGMFVAPIPKAKTNPEYNVKGLNCCISSWQRIKENSLSPRVKCGANYINSRMAQLEALDNGYDTTIFLNDRGNVSEGPGSCLFIVINGKLITPLLTDSVLASITRNTVITIAQDILKIPIEERSVDRTELYVCDEAFLCGSAMEITPVFSVDKYIIGNGIRGDITREIHEKYLEIVTGEREEYYKWLTPIY